MGLELSSIPAMSTEAERVISGYVLPARQPQIAPPHTPMSTSYYAGVTNLAVC
jgi:hypothetical protein